MEAVTSLKEILGVNYIPSFGADGESINELKEKHAKEIEELKAAHEEAMGELAEEKDDLLEKMKREYAQELQAAKEEAKLAELKLQAMQERLSEAGQERDDALARGYEMGLAKSKHKSK